MIGLLFTLASCVENSPERNEDMYEIYQLGVESGSINESYEEWVDSIEGDPGTDGRELVLGSSETHIQWKYEDSNEWHNLIAFSELSTGEDIAFREFEGNLQWKYDDEDSWKTLLETTNEQFVILFQNQDGTTIDIQTVIKGNNATAPDTPTHPSNCPAKCPWG